MFYLSSSLIKGFRSTLWGAEENPWLVKMLHLRFIYSIENDRQCENLQT